MFALASLTLLVCAHIAIVQEQFYVSSSLLTIALANVLSVAFCRTGKCKLLIIATGLLSVYLLLEVVTARQMTYYPPVLINSLFGLFFLVSLFPQRTPIITRVALLLNSDLSDAHKRYSRHATIAWAMFMFCLAIGTVIVAVYLPIEIWSLFVNFINYILVLIMFVVEFLVRRLVLNEKRMSFIGFLKSLAKIDIKKIIRQD